MGEPAVGGDSVWVLGVLSAIVSITALTVSALAFQDVRRRDRRDTFLRIHETLISEDKQYGRQLLFEKVHDMESVNALSRDEYRQINRALNMYEALGLYMRRGYIEERDVMEMWAVPVYRAWVRGAVFIEHRQGYEGAPIWPNFRRLADRCKDHLERTKVVISPSALQSRVRQPGSDDQLGGI